MDAITTRIWQRCFDLGQLRPIGLPTNASRIDPAQHECAVMYRQNRFHLIRGTPPSIPVGNDKNG
jgi:hypothetical protein